MMKKKIIVSTLIFVLLVGMLAGCGQTQQTPAENSETPADQTSTPRTLKIWSFSDEIKTFALAFQEKHPEIKVEYTMIPMTNGEYQTKLKSALQTGDVPDVVALEAAFVREYVEASSWRIFPICCPLQRNLKRISLQ